jgi:ABC-type multidrug transport system fused ATPase/permease subunit
MMTEKNINALLAVFFVVLTAGFLFHRSATFAGSPAGHLIGIAGAVLMFMTLIYPFKKRVLGRKGRKNPLGSHILYGLAGPSLVVIHSAHKLDSLIGLLTFLAMLIVVLSGIVGRYLFRSVNRTLKEQKKELETLKIAFQERREEITACQALFHPDRAEEETDAIEEEQRDRCARLYELARSISELEYATSFFDSTKSMFSKWMKVHHVLTLLLFFFVFLHILTVLYYGLRWLP